MISNLPAFSIGNVPLADRRNKWHTWKRGFEIWLRAAKVTEDSEKKDLLLAQGGFELQEIFFNIPGADVDENVAGNVNPYTTAIDKLDAYFAPQRHAAHERYIFWAMKPEPGESLEKFLMRAQVHASKCSFGSTAIESAGIAVIDKMLQFVPAHLRERLLQESELTLDEVIKQVNAYQTTRSASDQIGGQSMLQPPVGSTEDLQHIQGNCRFCGMSHGADKVCPAFNKTCMGCGKRGHFQAVCFHRTKTSNTWKANLHHKSAQKYSKRNHMQAFPSAGPSKVNYSNDDKRTHTSRQIHAIDDTPIRKMNVELVETVSSSGDSEELIWAKVGGILIEMQIDSGVQSNIIDDKTWEAMLKNGIQTIGDNLIPDRKFRAYAQKDCLVVSIMFDAEIVINDGGRCLQTIARFYVVKNGPQPLLGNRTAKELGVLIVGLPSQHERIRNVEVVRPFPSIKGVKIHIPVDKSVIPVAQRLRRLPFATLERVEEKLKELLAKDIIEQVSEPSRWVSPMVIVVKDTGDIRLCIDMRQVNKAILRETHPLPTIEDIRWKLNGATYFSRLDIKDAFHQLELDEESKPLTTFITHKGIE